MGSGKMNTNTITTTSTTNDCSRWAHAASMIVGRGKVVAKVSSERDSIMTPNDDELPANCGTTFFDAFPLNSLLKTPSSHQQQRRASLQEAENDSSAAALVAGVELHSQSICTQTDEVMGTFTGDVPAAVLTAPTTTSKVCNFEHDSLDMHISFLASYIAELRPPERHGAELLCIPKVDAECRQVIEVQCTMEEPHPHQQQQREMVDNDDDDDTHQHQQPALMQSAAPSPPSAKKEEVAAVVELVVQQQGSKSEGRKPSAAAVGVSRWEEEAKRVLASGAWREARDSKTNRVYFFCPANKKVCWNLPRKLQEIAAAERLKAGGGRAAKDI